MDLSENDGALDRDSKLELKVSIGIEFTRKRAKVTDRWETRLDAIGIVVVVGAIVLFIIIFIVPKLLSIL